MISWRVCSPSKMDGLVYDLAKENTNSHPFSLGFQQPMAGKHHPSPWSPLTSPLLRWQLDAIEDRGRGKAGAHREDAGTTALRLGRVTGEVKIESPGTRNVCFILYIALDHLIM